MYNVNFIFKIAGTVFNGHFYALSQDYYDPDSWHFLFFFLFF